jgi:hypothetical protein
MRGCIVVNLETIDAEFEQLDKLLSPLTFTNPKLLNYKPDFGLYLKKLGITKHVSQYFYGMRLDYIAKLTDDLYSAVLDVQDDGRWFCLSLDFNRERLQEFSSVLPRNVAAQMEDSLSQRPFAFEFKEVAPPISMEARLSDIVHSNKDEDFCPLRIERFIA